MYIKHLFAAILSLAMPAVAYAGSGTQLPEPETMALLGIGALALVIARWRRKK